MEGEHSSEASLLPLYIFFLIGAVVSSYLFGRYQNISQIILNETKVAGIATTNNQFQVENIKASVTPNEQVGCIYSTFHLTGFITANGKGLINYKWEGSDNSTLAPTSIEFESAGTKKVETDWQVFGAGERTAKLHVVAPNNVSSEVVSFALNCN